MNKQVFRNSIVIWAALGMISLSLFGQPPAEDEGSDIPKPVDHAALPRVNPRPW